MEKNKSFFDFDGTLIRINSFPYWIMFSGGYALISFQFGLLGKIINLLFKRKIQHKISHSEFKKKLVQLPISESSDQRFSTFLTNFVRKDLKKELTELYQKNHSIVISSAAPEVYLKLTIQKIFPRIHNHLFVIGSKIENGKLNNNYKEEKLINLYKIGFLNPEEKLKSIYTDSWDDASLAFHSDEIILISPKKNCQTKYYENEELSLKIRNSQKP